MMRKIIILAMVVALCCSMISCSREKEESSRGLNIMGLDSGIGETYGEDGILSLSQRGILWMVDLSTGDMAPICTRPECEHKGSSSANPNPDCDAYVGIHGKWFSLINGNIYYVLGKDNFTDYEICSMDVTGRNRKVISEILDTGTLSHAYCTEDYYVLSYDVRYNEKDELLKQPFTGIIVVNLKTGEIKKKEFTGEFGISVDHLWIEKEELFFSMSHTTKFYNWNDKDIVFDYDEWLSTVRSVIYRMSLDTMKEQAILSEEEQGLQQMNVGTHYGFIDGKGKKVINLKTAKVFSMEEFTDHSIPYGVGENEILINNIGEADKSELILVDTGKNEVLARVSYDHGMAIDGISGDKVFVSWGSGSSGDIPWRYISLRELLKGDATIHEIVQPEHYWD